MINLKEIVELDFEGKAESLSIRDYTIHFIEQISDELKIPTTDTFIKNLIQKIKLNNLKGLTFYVF